MNGMTGWLNGAYLWVQAAHVIFVIFWVAGLLIFPRHLTYQAACPPGSAEDRLWIERERLLKRVIMTPAIIAVWVLGLCLATSYGLSGEHWLTAKIALVLAMSGFHGWLSATSRKMAAGARPYAEKTFRRAGDGRDRNPGGRKAVLAASPDAKRAAPSGPPFADRG